MIELMEMTTTLAKRPVGTLNIPSQNLNPFPNGVFGLDFNIEGFQSFSFLFCPWSLRAPQFHNLKFMKRAVGKFLTCHIQ